MCPFVHASQAKLSHFFPSRERYFHCTQQSWSCVFKLEGPQAEPQFTQRCVWDPMAGSQLPLISTQLLATEVLEPTEAGLPRCPLVEEQRAVVWLSFPLEVGVPETARASKSANFKNYAISAF